MIVQALFEQVNDEGAAVALGKKVRGCDGSSKYFCGRRLGEEAIPGSDGRCGPDSGPQCQSCLRFQARQPPECQLREILKKKTVPDLIEECKAAGISGHSNKRKEELIDLLVVKKPRLDEQVAHRMPPICAVCALRSLSFCSLL